MQICYFLLSLNPDPHVYLSIVKAMAIQIERPRSKSSPPLSMQKTRQALLVGHQLPDQTNPVHWPCAFSLKSSLPIPPKRVMLSSSSYPTVDPDPRVPINPPSWHHKFHPRLPPDDDSQAWESPIPRCDSIGHAIVLREAMTIFHLGIYLADEDAGESSIRLRQNLAVVCERYMPAMVKLGVVSLDTFLETKLLSWVRILS